MGKSSLKLQHCMMLFEKLQKTGKTKQQLFEESCQTSEVVPDNPSQDEIIPGRLFIFLQKWLVTNLKNQKLKKPKIHVYKTNKTSTQRRKKTTRFSKNPIKKTGLLPYNTPLKCTYPGTFIQIPLKVVGHIFEQTLNLKNLKIQKFKNSKVQKFKDSKIQKFKKSKIQRFANPKIRRREGR